MSAERRYSEQEIATIFEQAAEAQEAAHRHLSHGEGLTLAELQQIGKEAGITPAFIARAAATVDRADSVPPPETYFGLPVSVARTVDLPGPLSDEDWDRLVVDLRETFQASGEVRREGSLREWRNGNLHALVEPTESGHRLHLRTRKGNAQNNLLGSLGFFAINLAFLLMLVVSGATALDPATWVLALLAAGGLGRAGRTAYRLPRWAEERGRQMDAVAARTIARLGIPPTAEPVHEAVSAGRLDLDALEDPADESQTRSQHRTRI